MGHLWLLQVNGWDREIFSLFLDKMPEPGWVWTHLCQQPANHLFLWVFVLEKVVLTHCGLTDDTSSSCFPTKIFLWIGELVFWLKRKKCFWERKFLSCTCGSDLNTSLTLLKWFTGSWQIMECGIKACNKLKSISHKQSYQQVEMSSRVPVPGELQCIQGNTSRVVLHEKKMW